MTRKLIIKVVACLYIAQGLWDIGGFFLPIFLGTRPLTLNLFAILIGAVSLWSGIYLFRLDEFGRKFAIGLLSLRISYNALFIIWALFQSDFSFVVIYFGKPLFVSESPYTFAVSLGVWILIAVAIILFLLQRETKMIFLPENVNEESSEAFVKTMSNQ